MTQLVESLHAILEYPRDITEGCSGGLTCFQSGPKYVEICDIDLLFDATSGGGSEPHPPSPHLKLSHRWRDGESVHDSNTERAL